MDDESFILNHDTQGTLPRVPFRDIKEAVLGKDYILTLNFISSEAMHRLNKETRNIDKTTDILSFPLGEDEGEIYIDLSDCEKEAKKFEREFENFIGFLFIHGLVHLKGHDHGDEMEKAEIVYRTRFKI